MMLLDTSSTTINIYYFKIMYEKLLDMNTLYSAYKKCKQSVDWKYSVQKYEHNVLSELNKLYNLIQSEEYKQSPFYEFDINERGKHRHIKSLLIKDRIIQRVLCDEILNPIILPHLIYDNGASVKGKGIDFARNRLKVHLQKYYRHYGHKGYILILDFHKFFDSIPHEQLMQLLRKYFDDDRVLNLVEDLILTFDKDNKGKSLGIGSQISQSLGIFYPTKIDNYCKIVKQCKYYGRYMDDLYIIHQDKKFLQQMLKDIELIAKELGLEINYRKTRICRIDKGFTYLKLYHFVTPTGKVIRKPCKKNITRERRKLKKLYLKLKNNEISFKDIQESYKSWQGNLKKYNCYYIRLRMDQLFNSLYKDYL